MSDLREIPVGYPLTSNGAVTLDGAEALDRIVRAIQTLEGGVVLTSPNGTRYRLEVDNAGNLSTAPV